MAAFPHQLLELAVERSALAHGKHYELQLLGGEWGQLGRAGSSLHRDGAGSTGEGCVNKWVLFLKKISGSFSAVPCFPRLFLSICPSP